MIIYNSGTRQLYVISTQHYFNHMFGFWVNIMYLGDFYVSLKYDSARCM